MRSSFEGAVCDAHRPLPGDRIPGDLRSGERLPEDTPGEAGMGGLEPGDLVSGDLMPEETPGEPLSEVCLRVPKPGDPKPGDPTPGDLVSGEKPPRELVSRGMCSRDRTPGIPGCAEGPMPVPLSFAASLPLSSL